LGTYVNASGKSNFTDYRSASVIDVQAGTSVKLTTEFSYFAYDEYWKIWLDLNDDGALDDATETVFQGKLNQPANGNAKHAINGTLSIPASAQAGTRLMRVSMKRGAYPSPCETLPFGEVEDYTARVVTGGTPVCSITAQASNVLCNNNGTATLSSDDTFGFSLLVNGTNTGMQGWTATVANQTLSGTYGVAKTFSGFAITAGNLNFTVRDVQTTTCQATVTVQAPATCSGGVTPPPQPCASAGVFPWHEWISRVRIGSAFDYQSGKSTFSDFKTATATAIRGQATAVQLTTSFSWFTYDEYYKIWVDINRDGAYEDATEMFYQGILTAPAAGTASKTLSGTMTIPAGTAVGAYTMRISMKRGGYPTPCESIAYGEVEEYTLQITAPQVLQSGNLSDVRNTELPQNELVVYPNPATSIVHVQWPGAAFGQVYLYSATGATLAKTQGSGSVEFDVSSMAEGLYFVRVEVDGKRAEVKRVVVVR
jgi:bacillolysin